MTRNEALVWASGFYLTEHIPLTLLEDGNDADIDEFMEEHVWETLTYTSIWDIWEMIEHLALETRSLVTNETNTTNQ